MELMRNLSFAVNSKSHCVSSKKVRLSTFFIGHPPSSPVVESVFSLRGRFFVFEVIEGGMVHRQSMGQSIKIIKKYYNRKPSKMSYCPCFSNVKNWYILLGFMK